MGDADGSNQEEMLQRSPQDTNAGCADPAAACAGCKSHTQLSLFTQGFCFSFSLLILNSKETQDTVSADAAWDMLCAGAWIPPACLPQPEGARQGLNLIDHQGLKLMNGFEAAVLLLALLRGHGDVTTPSGTHPLVE